jgi:hypothetical protein
MGALTDPLPLSERLRDEMLSESADSYCSHVDHSAKNRRELFSIGWQATAVRDTRYSSLSTAIGSSRAAGPHAADALVDDAHLAQDGDRKGSRQHDVMHANGHPQLGPKPTAACP